MRKGTKFKINRDSRYIYQNELDKTCFQYDKAYGDFKDLPRRTASHKVLRDKAFNIAENPKYDGYQRGLGSMVYKSFDEKSAATNANKSAGDNISDGAVTRAWSETLTMRDKSAIKCEISSKQQLPE